MATTTSTSNDSTDLNITKDEYIAFDALSIKTFIKDRLTESGMFTDQNFEGSNITAITNIVSYAFHVLMYYMNQTATESMFTEAQIYENINRVVKLINYSPVGAQTSTLTFSLSANANLPIGTYTIPRYTFIKAGNAQYSFNSDITFTKTLSGLQYLSTVGNQYLLYQGSYIEYPVYAARGEANETLFLIPGDGIIVDHFNIDVYVKSIETSKWTKWSRTDSLYLENATSQKYEVRLNGNKNYEIKFGNNINGLQLMSGDSVAVYFLQSLGADGQLGASTIDGRDSILYNTSQFNLIKIDTTSSDLTLLDDINILSLQFTNSNISTSFTDVETVESIRTNSPASFRSQFRVVTPSDYESYIKNNFANIINDVKALSNNSYVNGHLQYLYNIGLTQPGQDYRVLYNQVAFADSCNFNNVYVYILPKSTKLVTNNYINYLTPAQKQLIVSTINDKKPITSEVIVMDPVYLAVTTGITDASILDDVASSTLVVTLDRNSKTSPAVIKSKVGAIFTNYFDPTKITLGYTVNASDITNSILALDGVKYVTTQNVDADGVDASVSGVSLIIFNPSYPTNDITSTTKTFTAQPFQAVYLSDITDILNRIVVQLDVSQNTSIINF